MPNRDHVGDLEMPVPADRGPACRRHQVWTLVLTSLGLLMCVLDSLVVTTALPAVRVGLHAGLSDLEWTVNAFTLAFACFVLTGAAIGLWGGIAGLGVAVGPVVGGAVVSGIDWHWIFWLNVPIGIVLIPLAATRLSESFGPRPQLDLPGLLLAGAGALALTWGLVRANTAGWASAEVGATLLAGAALVAAFLTWERRAASPMLRLALFRSRAFSTANAVSFLMNAGMYGALFLMAQFLGIALGHSPLGTGIRLLPWTVTPMLVAPVAGMLADRHGNRPFMALGLALQATGYGWIALSAAPGMSYAELAAGFTVAGVGTSLCFPTVANAVMGAVPLDEAGVASGTNSALRALGGVLGVAVLAAVFTRPGVYRSPRLFVDGFSPALWIAAGLSALGIAAALLAPARRLSGPAPVVAQPALALTGQPE